MRVTVRLFARLREVTGRNVCDCEIAANATVADVWRDVVRQHPALEPFGVSMSAAVNADFARMQTVVHEGDEVAFLPPVSGGWQ
jgi:molybdopterin converting factor subunit 1